MDIKKRLDEYLGFVRIESKVLVKSFLNVPNANIAEFIYI
jgi:hypothetical protein